MRLLHPPPDRAQWSRLRTALQGLEAGSPLVREVSGQLTGWDSSPCDADGSAPLCAAMIQRMSVPNAEVAVTLVTSHGQHLFLLTALFRAPEGENLLLLPRTASTTSIHVLTNHHIRSLPLLHWDWTATERAHWHLSILLVCKGTFMGSVGKMIFTEILLTYITSQWKKI